MNLNFDNSLEISDYRAVIRKFAEDALELAETHRTPPYPKVYEVLYTYLSDGNPDLKARIEAMMRAPEPLSLEALLAIHGEFFNSERLATGITEIGSQVDQNIDAIVDLMSSGVEDSEDAMEKVGGLILKAGDANDAEKKEDLLRQIFDLEVQHLDCMKSLSSKVMDQRRILCALQKELEGLRNDALVDHLTQLSNRRHFDASLLKEIERARAKNSSLAIVICDIDHFKGFNDQHGHQAGDRLLQKVAEVIASNTKRGDVAARIGGEEFALILPSTSVKGAVALSEHLKEYISLIRMMDRETGARLRRITASFGVSVFAEDDSPESFFARADANLYEAKRAGRDRVVFSAKPNAHANAQADAHALAALAE